MNNPYARLTGMCAAILVGTVTMTIRSADASVILADWTFESTQPEDVGPHQAEAGFFASSSNVIRGNAPGNTNYSPSGGNNSAFAFRSNRWETGHYYEFTSSTLNYESITIQWDQERSGNAPASFQLSWSVNGVDFTSLLNYTVSTSWQTFGAIAAPAALNDANTVYFRLTAMEDGSGGVPSRTVAVDNVIIGGTLIPAPGTIALLGFAGLVTGVRRRRK